jgi:hypothetical protein
MTAANVRRRDLAIVAISLIGCGPAVDSAEAGVETGPCIEARCFEPLVCLSNLCVDPGSSDGATSGSDAAPGSQDDGDPPSGDSDPTTPDPPTDGSTNPSGSASDGTSGPASASDTSVTFTTGSPTGDDTTGGPTIGCGNDLVEPGEQCDGSNLQGFDCSSLGLGGGTLNCDPVTCTFDTSMCMATSGGSTGGPTTGATTG